MKVECGVSRREGERKREELIKGVREGAQEKTKDGVGRKWPLERTPEYLGNRSINKCQSNWL